ncbi:L,D-transpeptidase family protein [Priestia megaterium]|nr:L,D-transpeptidase family protein [Priestia megaterium]
MNTNGTYGDTYSIHGNNNEISIGKYVSQGCVRMHNADIEKLYDKV